MTAADPGVRCSVEELRRLFLFEKLTDEQLAWLCERGRVEFVESGRVYSEGQPATDLYVLLSGTIVLSRLVGGDDVEVVRSSEAGVYSGAFFAYLNERVPQVYNNSMRVIEPTRLFALDGASFAELMNDWFPMATHLLEGLFFGTKNTQEAIGQRERLLALGSLSAGLTHELNNPASAAVRATDALRDRVAGMRNKLGLIAAGPADRATLTGLIGLQEKAVELVCKATPLSPLEASDREDELTDWLEDHGIEGGWELAAVLTQAGADTAWLDLVAAAVGQQTVGASAGGSGGSSPRVNTGLERALRWLGYTMETELLMNEITDSVTRISSLVGAAKQYSQLDRAPYQVTDVRELIESTLMMLGGKIGPDITVVKNYAALPPIPVYASELNQVWTNLIDNAVAAMDGAGTLTVRTWRDQDQVVVEFGDTGSGIPAEIQGRIFEPFFTTKPVGQGTGLGLDISWRIVVNRHHGDLRVESEPGNTRFFVRLPISPREEVA
jgi:signal transduction histidine kinase